MHGDLYLCPTCAAKALSDAEEADLDRLLDAIDAETIGAPIYADTLCPTWGDHQACLRCQLRLDDEQQARYLEAVSRLSEADQTRLGDLAGRITP